MLKNWIATEEHSDEVQDVSLMEVPSESLESDLVEVTGLDKDVESLVADGEELEHDQEQVEALADNAEASLEEDGMDETAARATEIAAESFCGKWGIQRKKVGLESFGASDSRRHATQVAVESLKDTAVEMWNTFVKWLKELIAKAKEQLLKLHNAGKKMKSRADKLEARIDKGLGVLDKKEVDGGFVKQLVIDEKPDYEGCLAFATKSATDVEKMARAAMFGITDTNKLVREADYKAKKDNNGQFEKVAVTEFGKNTSKKLNVPQGSSNVSVSALPGNGYLLKYTHNGSTVLRYEAATDKIKDSKLATLSQEQCKSGVKALYTIGDVLENKLKDFQKSNEEMDKLSDAVEKARTTLKDADGDTRDGARAALTQARENVNSAKALERAAVSSLKNAGFGIAGYIAASIGAYKAA